MTVSAWEKNEVDIDLKPLERDRSCYVCVVGGGIGGLTTAYLLSKENVSVTVVYDGPMIGGETSRSSAQLNTVHDDGWAEMLKLHGQPAMSLCAQAYREAVEFIKNVVRVEGIECGFEELPAYLFSTTESGGAEWIEKEFQAATECGVEKIRKVDRVPNLDFNTGPALIYENQAQFDPVKYLRGLLEVLVDSGVTIFPDTRVTQIEKLDSHLIELVTNRGVRITAQHVVLASNVPFHHKLIPVEALEPYRSYVITAPLKEGATLENAQYWDNLDPYHYVRLMPVDQSQERLLLIGGQDRRVGKVENEEEQYNSLLSWGLERFPIQNVIWDYWSAQTIETFDRMPLIGNAPGDPPNIQIITGDSGTGLTHATIGAQVVCDNIMGRINPYADLFSASRGRSKAVSTWLGQNLRAAGEYRDWLAGDDIPDAIELEPGQGAVVREGVKKIALYRDPDGKIHRFSAVCPHLGAVIRWNAVENSWDCPAHGSRFSCTGCPIHGPASGELSPA